MGRERIGGVPSFLPYLNSAGAVAAEHRDAASLHGHRLWRSQQECNDGHRLLHNAMALENSGNIPPDQSNGSLILKPSLSKKRKRNTPDH